MITKSKKSLYGNTFEISMMIIPVLFLAFFVGLPLLYTVVLSFQEVDALELNKFFQPFAGFNNYISVITNEDFWLILKNTFLFVGLSILFQVIIGLLLALAFSKKFPGAPFMRGLFLVPWIMPQLVVGAIWGWMLQANAGVVNYLLRITGFISENIAWISDANIALYSVIAVNIWLGIPFNVIMLSTALMDLPAEIYEAAEVDGAGPVKRFFFITLPLLKIPLISVISLGVIFTLQQFDIFQALTEGGPANSSNVLQLWSWRQAFREFDFGQGSAIAVLVICIMLVACVFYVASSRKKTTD